MANEEVDKMRGQLDMMRKMMGNKKVNKITLKFIESAAPKGDDIPEEQKIGTLVAARVGEYAIQNDWNFNQYFDAIGSLDLPEDKRLADVEAMELDELFGYMTQFPSDLG